MTASMPSLVQLRDVSFAYPDATAVAIDHQDWDIASGEMILVSGQSGSGKSTLLRSLNGLVPHFSGGRFGGTVTVRGLNTRTQPPSMLSRHVGMVFQHPETQVLASTVDEDIAFSLEQHGVPPAVMRKRVEELLDLLSIASLRDRSPATLSGGERQRVAIAGALALHPDLLVLDEPTSQLDPWGAEDVLAALVRLNEDLGLSVVLAEHRLERLLHRVDTVVEVAAGRLQPGVSSREFVRRANPMVLPPVSRLGAALQWHPTPLTIKEGRRFATVTVLPSPQIRHSPEPGNPIITATGVSLNHGHRRVLSGLNLTLHEGEIIALVGRNGSGKTTLIRALLGHHPLAQGSVTHAGQPDRHPDPSSIGRTVGYVPQQPTSMFFADTAREEIAFTARNRGVDPDDALIDAVLDRVGLHGFANHHPRDLSGGEQERLALAIMLTGNPAALLLDEPTRGMDAWRKHNLARVLRDYRNRGGAALMATHDVELVAGLADRVVMLGHREIIAEGSPAEVLGGSLTFTTQTQLLFGNDWLTPETVIDAITGDAGPESAQCDEVASPPM